MIAIFLSSGCTSDDVGHCCKVLKGDQTIIPQPEFSDTGEPRDQIRVDPAFDCEELTCISYQGTKAYCSKKCEFDSSCPEGFACAPVLQSSPGPNASIQPTDTFCVRAPHTCEE